MQYINTEPVYTYSNRVMLINVDGLKNNPKSNEYGNIFEKNTISLVADIRLTNDKLSIVKDLAEISLKF